MRQSDIHTDGCWQPGGAQGAAADVLRDGERYLLAIYTSGKEWEIHSVSAVIDASVPVHGLFFNDPAGDAWGVWDWSDVEWFTPVADLHFPEVTNANDD